jgi:uncharacterized protein YdhG (YjbR/CyaY superfamily)
MTTANIDAYLGALPADARTALEKLRQTVVSAAPWAAEAFNDGLPAFELDGRPLVRYGASKDHCGFYPMSPGVIAAYKGDLEGFNTSNGTIRFAADNPLPPSLVRRLVWARIAELRNTSTGK